MQKARVIYCYPFVDVGNAYINKEVELWRSMGFIVKSCWSDIWEDRKLSRSERIIILNWFEDWMLIANRPKIVSLIIASGLLVYFTLMSEKIIWVRHNYKPHSVTNTSWEYRILVYLLRLSASQVLTHRAVTRFPSKVVPHPLVSVPSKVNNAARDVEFLWFGMVREYKALDTLLMTWPQERPLLVLGQSSDADLTARINSIIAARALRVEWHNRYIPDSELNDTLARTKYVVLAHQDQSMLVSGVFFHAIANGTNVLVRDGEFARAMAKFHSFVHPFEVDELDKVLLDVGYIAPADVISEAQDFYGDDACRSAWAKILD